MSEYNKTILTNAGIDLARRANKGVATFQLTRGVSSTENLSGKTIEELQNLTQLPSVQQSVILSDVVNTTDNPDTVLGIRMTFDNQNLKTGYNVHTVGVYAKEPGKDEILYGVATAKTPEYIPDFGEQTLFKFDFLMYLVIGRTDKVTVQVSPDDVYRKKDTYNKAEIDAKVSDAVSQLNNKDAEILKNLNDYKQENKTYHQNLEQQLDTKADKSAVNQQFETKADKNKTYTKEEVTNLINPKADKSTTYTKAEVDEISKHWKSEIHHDAVDLNTLHTAGHYILDSLGNLNTPPDWVDKRVILDVLSFDSNARIQIAYGVGASGNKVAYRYWEWDTYQPWQTPAKSVNGHKADADGNIQLPRLKATTLINYDVKNKAATFDENAGFDGNGMFSRWPVDQGVIGQLADAINAKLPIEAGAVDDDLCHLTSSKISFWNGNGDKVKNLPPMKNKVFYFAIRLVVNGWGSVTVVDQDGTYWLNTKNGDVWTGWRSVTTNETLKKLKFVKQSVNQNGDTFQDTKFVTQETDGTFKINIYDSDWTASKVSWLLKNTQSYNISANTNLNDIKAPGLYHCSGKSNIVNAPSEDNWFNMIVNSDNWNGSQTFYATNSNKFYVRTWNATAFTAWRRVINDDDLKVTVVREFDVATKQSGTKTLENLNSQWLVDQSALLPFAEAINSLKGQGTYRINNAVDVNTLTGIPNQVTVYILTNGNNRGIPIALTNPSLNDARGTLIVFNYDGNAKTQIWMPVGTSGQMGFAWRYWEGQYAPAWHTYYDTITSLGSATNSLREDMTKFQQRVDPNTPKGSFNNQTVNINDLRETGIYRFANCHIQNGPYTNDYAHWIYLKVTVFDANTVYQTLYEGDNMYGRKSSSPSDWGRWRRYLNEVI